MNEIDNKRGKGKKVEEKGKMLKSTKEKIF